MSQAKRARSDDSNSAAAESSPKIKPNFALSGLLAADRRTGNLQKPAASAAAASSSSSDKTTTAEEAAEVVVSRYSAPADALPPSGDWRVFAFPPPSSSSSASSTTEQTLHLHRKSHYVFGTSVELADYVVETDSSSSVAPEHAVLQYRRKEGNLYLIDLESSPAGTKLNGERVVPARYIQLLDGDLVNFGNCEWDFIVKRPAAASS